MEYKKEYKFSYGSKLKKFLSKFIMMISNFLSGALVFSILGILFLEVVCKFFESYLSENVIAVFAYTMLISLSVLLLIYTSMALLPQKVIIERKATNEISEIKVFRHCLLFGCELRGFNDKIKIEDINRIYRPKKFSMYILEPAPVGVIDWKNLVAIEKKSTKAIYYMPVENSDEFIKNIEEQL